MCQVSRAHAPPCMRLGNISLRNGGDRSSSWFVSYFGFAVHLFLHWDCFLACALLVASQSDLCATLSESQSLPEQWDVMYHHELLPHP
mmetsp:Transcript_11639/g.36088  ORF Transcript_11639/g.36088 Transcript_11639/m.36088 type:complete len:88 (+) Transcript_11639:1241-1504(+)|eukprot:scaffold19061_cov31-Tisochrysis_lutea.AAC.5